MLTHVVMIKKPTSSDYDPMFMRRCRRSLEHFSTLVDVQNCTFKGEEFVLFPVSFEDGQIPPTLDEKLDGLIYSICHFGKDDKGVYNSMGERVCRTASRRRLAYQH